MPHVSSCLSTAVTTTKHRRAPVVPTEFPALFQERNLRGNGKGEERKCMKGKIGKVPKNCRTRKARRDKE